MDGSHGTIADGCLAVLPRLKGRTNFLCAFCFSLFGGVYYKSLRSTIIPELSRLTGTWFFLGVFVLSQSGFFHCRDQACFLLPHNFICEKSLKIVCSIQEVSTPPRYFFAFGEFLRSFFNFGGKQVSTCER
jgi:hypothetical protein